MLKNILCSPWRQYSVLKITYQLTIAEHFRCRLKMFLTFRCYTSPQEGMPYHQFFINQEEFELFCRLQINSIFLCLYSLHFRKDNSSFISCWFQGNIINGNNFNLSTEVVVNRVTWADHWSHWSTLIYSTYSIFTWKQNDHLLSYMSC